MFLSMRGSLVNNEDPWHDRYFPAWSLWLGGGLLSKIWLWRIWAVLPCLATLTFFGLSIEKWARNITNQLSSPTVDWIFTLLINTCMVLSEVLALWVTAHAENGSIPLVASAGLLLTAAIGLGMAFWQTPGWTFLLFLLPSYRVAALFVYDCTFIRKEVSEMKGSMLTEEQKATSYLVLMARVSQLQQTHKWWLICSSVASIAFLLILVYNVIMFKGRPQDATFLPTLSVLYSIPVVPPSLEFITMGYTNRAIETMERQFFNKDRFCQDRVTMLHLQIVREPARLSFLGIPITVNKAVSIVFSFAATAAFQAIRSSLQGL